jgi:hypothetical protein
MIWTDLATRPNCVLQQTTACEHNSSAADSAHVKNGDERKAGHDLLSEFMGETAVRFLQLLHATTFDEVCGVARARCCVFYARRDGAAGLA